MCRTSLRPCLPLLLAALSCAPSLEGAYCESRADCPTPGEQCVDFTCVRRDGGGDGEGVEDAGAEEPIAGEDGGVVEQDAGAAEPDAGGGEERDAGAVPQDGGAMPSDGGAVQVDGGAGSADGGTPSPDAGTQKPQLVALSTRGQSGTAGTLLSWRHVVDGGEPRLLLVGAGVRGNSEVRSVSYADAGLYRIAVAATPTDTRTELWALDDPPVGEHDVVVKMMYAQSVGAGAMTWTHAQLGARDGGTGNSQLATLSIPGPDGGVLVTVIASQGLYNEVRPAADAGMAELWKTSQSMNNVVAAASQPAGSASTARWNVADAGGPPAWSQCGVVLLPAP